MLLLLFTVTTVHAQKKTEISGKIGGIDSDGNHSPLVGAYLIWQGSSLGTVTDENGEFTIEKPDSLRFLIVSYVGFINDTIDTRNQTFIHTMLQSDNVLDEVTIEDKGKSSEITKIDPLNARFINQKELQKAACCNLSESFETNPSIDVSFTDAVTGTRQIQMLGLSGPNILLTREMIPDLRGLAAIHGLQFIPGTWIQSIQLNKGSGSVINGPESVVGHMNVELKKPEIGKKALVNLYANGGSALELNANVRSEINHKFSTASMIQIRNLSIENDRNGDGFRDMPLSEKYIALHRWKYTGENGHFGQIGVRGLYTLNKGGQMSDAEGALGRGGIKQLWKMVQEVKRGEIWAKTGKVWDRKPWKSLGIQFNSVYHEIETNYGSRAYNGDQLSFYANLIYQSMISNTNHTFKTGLSYQSDLINENTGPYNLANSNVEIGRTGFRRDEYIPGAFFEYAFLPSERFTSVLGMRGDYHNNYGFFMSPRLHMRYALLEKTTFKISGGKSFRTASIFAENQSLFATARSIYIGNVSGNAIVDINSSPYGLKAEEAWNYGINVIQEFELDYREGNISLDLYRTEFLNQIIVDFDYDPREIHFYNLEGKSFSNSFQIQLDYELINRLDLRLAYRWYDVQLDYIEMRREKPLLSRHRAFINLAYETPNDWSFDWTLNWNSSKRIPSTQSNPTEYRKRSRSPQFYLMNAQVTKSFREVLDIYLGGENLLNFRQNDPIISSDDPFNSYFDSSLVWGPIFGRMVYVGVRYKWL